MTWVKLDDHFPEHPKVLKAGPMAAWLYVSGLTYASRYLTDGFIPSDALPVLLPQASPKALAQKLVEVGLWLLVDGGWQIHDYHEYQPSGEQVRQHRASNAARQARHRGKSNGESDDNSDDRNGVTSPSVTPLARGRAGAAPVPVPGPLPPNPHIATPGCTPSLSGGAGGRGVADAPQKPGGKRKGSRAPEDFSLTERHYELAETYGVSRERVPDQTARFLDFHRARGTLFLDWQAGWRTWMQRVNEYSRTPTPIRPPARAMSDEELVGDVQVVRV
jgi:hypothetical protein